MSGDREDLGFAFRTRASGEVVILRGGAVVTALRGAAAAAFLAKAARRDPAALQELMARATGQYRRGNERTAGRHPRNRGQVGAHRAGAPGRATC